jgi:hypothetical protein
VTVSRRLRLCLIVTATSLACQEAPSDPQEPYPGAWSLGTGTERTVYLWFADGKDPPDLNGPCKHNRPPSYSCRFGATPQACQLAIYNYLADWYATLSVHFTTYRPPTNARYDTVIITTNGDWCGDVAAGLAPFTCDALETGTVWAFACGDSAQRCAAIIAQEQAHIIGLEHTASPADVMANPLCDHCVGFENRLNPVVAGRCRSTQNSFSLMHERLPLRATALESVRQNSEP